MNSGRIDKIGFLSKRGKLMKLDLSGFASSGSNKYDLSPKKSNIQYISRAIGRHDDNSSFLVGFPVHGKLVQHFLDIFVLIQNWLRIFWCIINID